MSGNDDFLSRWSRRKRAVEEEDQLAPEPGGPVEETARHEEPADERSDEEILEELGLPHPDEMKEGDDFRGFMASAVPDHLRRLALRKLWRSNPVLACVDGLNDYDGDFTNAATDAPNLKTAYKVGRGFVRNLAEIVPDGDEKVASAAGPQDLETDAAGEAESELDTVDSPADPALVATGEPVREDREIAADLPRARRMRFRFEGDA